MFVSMGYPISLTTAVSRVDCLSFELRGYHYLTAICWVCCGVSIFSVGGLGRGSGSVLIHLTMAELLLRFHRFSTNDCRGSGPRRTCLSSSTVSRRPSFASIWRLHSYPSCGTPEVSILTFKRKPAFDVLLIRIAASRSTSKVGLRHWPLPLLSSMRKWRTFITDADPTSH